MSLFSNLPVSLPVPTPSLPIPIPSVPSVPVVGPLAGALLGANSSNTSNASGAPATNAANATQPFQIPVANPLTGAIQLVQGNAQDGLKNLDDGTKAVLANAAEIPIVHSDGSVTTVPGGAAGLQALQDNVAQVLSSAPAATKLDPLTNVASAVNGIVGATGATASLALAAANAAAGATASTTTAPSVDPFKLPPNPITGAASVVQGTFNAGVSGLNDLAKQTIGNAPQIPVVLPSGQLSIVPGGTDGLAALQNDAHNILANAPKLPGLLDITAGATGAAGALGGGLLGGALNTLTGGQSGGILTALQDSKSLIEEIQALPGQIHALSQQIVANAKNYVQFFSSEKIGPAEIDTFFADHANTVLKVTLLAIAGVSSIIGVSGTVVLVSVIIALACVPVLFGLVALLGFEVLVWRHWRNVRASEAAAATASSSANGTAVANGVH